jgi:hypothetical protein
MVLYSPFRGRTTRPWARIAQWVQRLATGWTFRISNPGGGEVYRTRRDRLWAPPNLLFKVPGFYPSGEAAGARFPAYGPLKINLLAPEFFKFF